MKHASHPLVSKIFIIFVLVLGYGLHAIFLPVLLMATVMGYDSPEAANSLLPLIIGGSILLVQILLTVVPTIFVVRFFRREKHLQAFLCSLIPVIFSPFPILMVIDLFD